MRIEHDLHSWQIVDPFEYFTLKHTHIHRGCPTYKPNMLKICKETWNISCEYRWDESYLSLSTRLIRFISDSSSPSSSFSSHIPFFKYLENWNFNACQTQHKHYLPSVYKRLKESFSPLLICRPQQQQQNFEAKKIVSFFLSLSRVVCCS